MKKFNVVTLAFMLLFLAFSANVAADGSTYFDTVSVGGVPCYVVPEALDSQEVSDDTVFFLPVSLYDGYESVFAVIAACSDANLGLAEEEGEEISDILYDIWSDDNYGEACLNDVDAATINSLWEKAKDAYWNDDPEDDPFVVIYNCLPNWAYEMREACWEITYLLSKVYDFVNGDSYYDSIEEIVESDAEDFGKAVNFVNTYFPELEF